MFRQWISDENMSGSQVDKAEHDHLERPNLETRNTAEVSRNNHFLPTMRKLGMIVTKPTIGRWSEICPDLCRNLATPRSVSPRKAA
jgi:hypothetical protein